MVTHAAPLLGLCSAVSLLPGALCLILQIQAQLPASYRSSWAPQSHLLCVHVCNTYEYMCLCLCVCAHMCMCWYVWVCVHVCAYECNLYGCARACMLVCLHMCMCDMHTHVNAHAIAHM